VAWFGGILGFIRPQRPGERRIAEWVRFVRGGGEKRVVGGSYLGGGGGAGTQLSIAQKTVTGNSRVDLNTGGAEKIMAEWLDESRARKKVPPNRRFIRDRASFWLSFAADERNRGSHKGLAP